jgi:hypothetical protein
MSDRTEPDDSLGPPDDAIKPLLPPSFSDLLQDPLMPSFLPQASGGQWLHPIRDSDEAAAFTATAANLRNVLYSYSSVGRPVTLGTSWDDIFAKQYQLSRKRSETAQIILKRLAELKDASTIRHIVISAFAFYEPFKAGQEFLLLTLDPPGSSSGRLQARSTLTEFVLGRWDVQFDGNTNESAYFQIAIEGLLLCAVTYPTHWNIDKPGLALDVLRYVKQIYQGKSEKRSNQFRALVDSYANRSDLSQYQARRLHGILDE